MSFFGLFGRNASTQTDIAVDEFILRKTAKALSILNTLIQKLNDPAVVPEDRQQSPMQRFIDEDLKQIRELVKSANLVGSAGNFADRPNINEVFPDAAHGGSREQIQTISKLYADLARTMENQHTCIAQAVRILNEKSLGTGTPKYILQAELVTLRKLLSRAVELETHYEEIDRQRLRLFEATH